ncbi:hypothetical protein HZB93_01465 [Candidatus Falkowbacteria bacterium]|nr:hypothetical protein [Candidatus Falkowbacteria bacterium]
MKKSWIVAAVVASLLFQVGAASAITSGEAKQEWRSAQSARIEADAAYKQAQLDYAADKTPENDKKVIDTAKTVLDAALNEAEAWLNWKNLEAKESGVPADIKANIETDVNKNLAKIATLRQDVLNIKTRAEVGVVFLKMIGSYVELLADVARNTGAMWVYLGNEIADKTAGYEVKLRAAAEKMSDNAEIMAKLDVAKSEIDVAKNKIKTAEGVYKKVVLPGTPLIMFAEGNEYLRQARLNLINAHIQLENAFNLITSK